MIRCVVEGNLTKVSLGIVASHGAFCPAEAQEAQEGHPTRAGLWH